MEMKAISHTDQIYMGVKRPKLKALITKLEQKYSRQKTNKSKLGQLAL